MSLHKLRLVHAQQPNSLPRTAATTAVIVSPFCPIIYHPATELVSPFMSLLKHPLTVLGNMELIFFLVTLPHLTATGIIAGEYDFSNEAIVNCTFPENVTRTDFAVYFYYENGKTDLLVDCAWVEDKHECIQQKGFKCRLPVPNTAEIEVPQTYATRPGKIGYILRRGHPSNAIFCHFVGNHSEGRKESQNKSQQNNIKENSYHHEASRDFPLWIIGLAIGTLLTIIICVIGTVVYKTIYRRKTQKETPCESDAESLSSESTDNISRDDNSSNSSVNDHVVSFSIDESSSPEDMALLNS